MPARSRAGSNRRWIARGARVSGRTAAGLVGALFTGRVPVALSLAA